MAMLFDAIAGLADSAQAWVHPIRLVALFTVIFLLSRWGLRSDPRPGGRALPGPRTWPIVGSLPAVVWYSRKYGHRAFTEMYRRHGPVFGLKVAPGQLLVVLNDLETIKEAFVDQASQMTSRHVQGLVKVSFPIQGSLAWENGEIWAARRRFILSAFRTLGFTKSGILGQRIQDEARALCTSIDKYKGAPFHPKQLLECATSNLFCAIALGDRYDYDNPMFCALMRNSAIIIDNLSAVSIGNCLPFLYYTPLCREYRDAVVGLTDFIQGLVEEHKVTYNCNNPRDVVDLYLAEVTRTQGENKKIKFNEEDVWRSMMDVLIAGSFTTAAHILWTLLFVTQYPDVQAKIHNEIDNAIGQRTPSLDDRQLLPFAQATQFEVLRFRLATVTIPHLASEDSIVGGCFIPKGSQVIANLWALHHDPKEWDEPEKFNPSRFLTKDGLDINVPNAFMPFGVGPRVCPGEQFSKHKAFLIFVSIMQRYRITLPASDPQPDMEGKVCGPALKPDCFRICAEMR